MNLIRSELLKIRSTNTWWIFALISLPLWAITLLFNWLQYSYLLDPNSAQEPGGNNAEAVDAITEAPAVAAGFYTNGQFFGVLIVMLLGVIVVTNEFFHQTVTTTFLTTPNRTAVVLAKLATASFFGLLFWLVTTAINIPLAAIFLSNHDLGLQLGDGAVLQAIALNALAYLLWAVFGIGFGVLIRSQIGATVTAILLYFIGFIGPAIFFSVLANRFGEWINELQVLIPSVASQLMVAGTELPGSPPQWVGAVVLVSYAVITGTIGTLIMRKRDIS